RVSLHRGGVELLHCMSPAVRGFRFATDVRARDRTDSPTVSFQRFPHPRRNSRARQVVGRVHCRRAMGRLLGTAAPWTRFTVEDRFESGLSQTIQPTVGRRTERLKDKAKAKPPDAEPACFLASS